MDINETSIIEYEVYTDSEIVIGLVAAVGTELSQIIEIIKNKLRGYRYATKEIKISRDIMSEYSERNIENLDEYNRITEYMSIGNKLREISEGYLGIATANYIYKIRQNNEPKMRTAYIIRSLKNEEEVNVLRSIYGNGFYLIGIYTEETRRIENLVDRQIDENNAIALVKRDENEDFGHGQHTRDTFQMADFFVDCNSNLDKTKSSIHRIIDLIFNTPFITPTFSEYAMFMAYCSSLRSADLSRQIGAAICIENEVIATGVNDCPKYNGGLYWHYYNEQTHKYGDDSKGRDYKRGEDPNKKEFAQIANEVLSVLEQPANAENLSLLRKTRLGALTEYGRVVHAEMEALAMCARNNISCRGADIYVTTFPCHNCAKHIIASGIHNVIYIEPYPKSKAFEFYSDAISRGKANKKVAFVPFFGVGPRRFIQMFAMKYGTLNEKIRKKGDGKIVSFVSAEANIRDQMLPSSYLEREQYYSKMYEDEKEKVGGNIQ